MSCTGTLDQRKAVTCLRFSVSSEKTRAWGRNFAIMEMESARRSTYPLATGTYAASKFSAMHQLTVATLEGAYSGCAVMLIRGSYRPVFCVWAGNLSSVRFAIFLYFLFILILLFYQFPSIKRSAPLLSLLAVTQNAIHHAILYDGLLDIYRYYNSYSAVRTSNFLCLHRYLYGTHTMVKTYLPPIVCRIFFRAPTFEVFVNLSSVVLLFFRPERSFIPRPILFWAKASNSRKIYGPKIRVKQ